MGVISFHPSTFMTCAHLALAEPHVHRQRPPIKHTCKGLALLVEAAQVEREFFLGFIVFT